MPKCPHCEILLSAVEAAGEKCPVCLGPLAGHGAGPPAGRAAPAPSRERPMQFAAAKPPMPGRCDVCCQTKPLVETRFFKLYRMTFSILLTATSRWLLVSCRCCEECFRKRLGDGWRRLLLTLLMVLAPFAALLVVVPMIETARVAGHKELVGPLIGLLALGGFGPFVFVPILLHFRVRRQASGLFDAETQSRLRAVAGVKKWGIRCSPVFLRKPPSGTTAVELEVIRALPDPGRAEAPDVAILAPRFGRWQRIVVLCVVGYIAISIGAYAVWEWFLRPPTPEEALVSEYAPRFEELQGRITGAVDALPPAGQAKDARPSEKLDPKPESRNTIFMSVHECSTTTPGYDPVPMPDPRLQGDERDTVFGWQPRIKGVFYGKPDDLRPRYEELLASRYLLAVRFADYVEPKVGDQGLDTGSAQVEAFLIDLETGKRLASIATSVSGGEAVWVYNTTADEAARKQLAEFVSSAVRKEIGERVGAKFETKDLRFARDVDKPAAP